MPMTSAREREGGPGAQGSGTATGPELHAPQTRASASQDGLGAQLKAVYDEVVRQPLPDRLMALLADLEAREKGGA